MKIGIMTFHAAPNHGAALQAYALQAYLKKVGHDPFFINYLYNQQVSRGLLGWVGRTPGNTLEKWDNRGRSVPFKNFQRKYLTVGTDRYVNISQLRESPPRADAYICGSDQVWNPNFLKKPDDEHAFWLDFGGNAIRRVAYAPSFGVTELDEAVCNRFAVYAHRFDAVSVREDSGQELLREIGRNDAVIVPDPTFLLEEEEYGKFLAKDSDLSIPYIFSYQLQTRRSLPTAAKQIFSAVRVALDSKVYHSYSASFFYNIFFRRYLGPAQWLCRLKFSSFVVTNSFHGTVFSILFHRPFISILRNGSNVGMNDRITFLLKSVGLQERAVNTFEMKKILNLCNEEIDWSCVDKKIEKIRNAGRLFIARSIS